MVKELLRRSLKILPYAVAAGVLLSLGFAQAAGSGVGTLSITGLGTLTTPVTIQVTVTGNDITGAPVSSAPITVTINPPSGGSPSPSGSISASPNPCTITSGSTCTSNITWTTSNVTAAQVWVSQNGGTESNFASCAGASCSQSAPWIQGSPNYYNFNLYDYSSGSRGALLNTVRVTASGGGGPACGASGQACCSGNVCNNGLSCTSGICQSPAPPSGTLSVNGSSAGATLQIGAPYTLTLASNIKTTPFTFYWTSPTGTTISAASYGTTDGSGGWTLGGNVSGVALGTWQEWIVFPTQGNYATNKIAVTITSSGGGPSPVNGACATPPNGGTYASAPGAPYCNSGTASALSGSGPWTCAGSGGGTTASCSAAKTGAPSTVTSVSVVCAPSSISVNGTSQCTPTVNGTGAFSSAVTWSVVSGGGSINASGVYTAPAGATAATIQATSVQDASKSGTTPITVSNAPSTVTSVTVDCTPSSISVNATSNCTATVNGTNNPSQAVTWSATGGGSIDSSGIYTAPGTATTATITATSVQDASQSGTNTVTVNAATFNTVSLNVSPNPSDTATPVTLTATVGGTETGTINYNFWWDCSSNATTVAGAVAACGDPTSNPAIGFKINAQSATSYSAPAYTYASAGMYTPKVIIERGASPSVQDQDSLTINSPASTVSSVTVSCTPSSIAVSATSNCTATVNGTNGPSQAVTWSVTGGGSINGSGVYTAPATGATATITATSVQDSSQSGTTTIIVNAPAAISLVVAPSQTVPVGTQVTITATGGTGTFTSWTDAGMTTSGPSGPGNDTLTGSYTTAGVYQVTVTDSAGTIGTANITVFACNFTASPSTIVPPETSTLQWSCQNAVTCSINGSSVAANETVNGGTLTGSLSVAPTTSTVYNLSCQGSGGGGSFQAATNVTVSSPIIHEQ